MTREEVANRRMRGPFNTASQMEEDLGAAPCSWRALHRFAIRQGEKSNGAPKWRCCDNGRSSGTNACLSGPETITCQSAMFPALVARVLAEMWPAELRLPPMRHRTEDVDGAYRRLPCAHPESTVVMVWDAERKCVAYYTMDGHNLASRQRF
jgi:hypothetical protein